MKSNTRFKKNTKGIECLNCKQPINTVDNFCSNCGQVNDTKPLSLKQYITELLGGFFAFDTRTLNTLIPLLTKPGKVTKDYIDGKRMQYVNPFQLYLHASIIFFLVTGFFMSMDKYNNLAKTNHSIEQQKKDSIIEEVSNNFNSSFQVKENGKGFSFTFNTKPDSIRNKFKNKIINKAKKITNQKELLAIINDSILDKDNKDKKINSLLNIDIGELYSLMAQDSLFRKDKLFKYKKFKKLYFKSAVEELKNKDYELIINKKKNPFDNITTSSGWLKKYTNFYNSKTKDVEKALDSLGYDRTKKNVFFFKKLKEFKKATRGGDAGRSFFNKMISKSSIVMFFMLPLFTLFLSLIYIRSKKNYTEHLIFVFNIQTVFFILFLLSVIVNRIFDTEIGTIFILGFLLYLYKAMRKFYQQGRIKTIIKFLMLNWIYMIISIFGFIMVGFLAIIM